MMLFMRSTVRIDDDLLLELKDQARKENISLTRLLTLYRQRNWLKYYRLSQVLILTRSAGARVPAARLRRRVSRI